MNHPQPYNTQVLSTNPLSPNILLILKTLNNVFGSILPSSKKDNPTFINSSRFFANDLIREELAKSIISSTSNNAIKLVPFSRSSWELKRSSTLRFQMKLQNRSLPLGTQLNRLKMH